MGGIQEFLEQHPSEEHGVTAFAVEGRHDQRRLGLPKHVDEFLHRAFVNQGMIDGAKGNSLDCIIEDPD